jgi:hypothetical protein
VLVTRKAVQYTSKTTVLLLLKDVQNILVCISIVNDHRQIMRLCYAKLLAKVQFLHVRCTEVVEVVKPDLADCHNFRLTALGLNVVDVLVAYLACMVRMNPYSTKETMVLINNLF